jgi:hypothetical protein
MTHDMRSPTQKGEARAASFARTAQNMQHKGREKEEHSPGGAKAGHASLMRPNRPLPTLPFVNMPLRRSPNVAAAVIAA